MQTITGPVNIYVKGLTDGQLLILFKSSSYVLYWLLFLVLGALVYVMVARGIFARALEAGQKLTSAATSAQVAGLFGVVVAFYAVFFFSPARVEAWFLEITLLWIWFIFFLFSYLTAQ